MPAPALPTDRDVWRIAAPMILSNLSVPLLGMVDTAVTGHLDRPVYLGAVATGSVIFSVLFTGMNFLRMGTTGIAAQRFGAGDNDGLRVALGQALVVATLIAALLIVVQQPVGALSMSLVGGTDELREYALLYFHIRIWSAPATLANMVLVGWFIGLSNGRVPLVLFLTVNVTNIALDILFVIGFGMGVAGVALASVIAEYAGLSVGAACAMLELKRRPGHWLRANFARLREYGAFFAVNANLFVRTMALMFTITFVTARGARMGDVILATNAIMMNFQNLTAFALDGIAHAAEALVGRAVGARDPHAFQKAVSLCLKWSLVFAGAFSLAYWLAGPALIALLTDLPAVRAAAIEYLPWMIASPLVSAWSFLYDGVFVGATRSRDMRNVMLLAAAGVFLPAWWLLQGFGNHGLWAAFLLFLAARGIGMHVIYRRTIVHRAVP